MTPTPMEAARSRAIVEAAMRRFAADDINPNLRPVTRAIDRGQK